MDLSQHWVEEAQVTRVQVQLRSQQQPVRLHACMLGHFGQAFEME